MQKHHRLLGIPLLTFLICFLWVGYNNRFASDDFEFLNKLREYGYAGSVAWFHEHWNTRWASIGLLNGVLLFTIKSGSLIWYHLLSIGLLWWAFYRNIRNVITQDWISDIMMAGYGAVAFFYACFSISDVFFWINTSTMYLYGCVALLFAVAEITSKRHSVSSYLRLACFGLFLAGAYEPLVFTVMISCVVIISVLVSRHKWNVWRIPVDKKIIILLSALMLGFAISFSGEGHVVRAAYLPQTGLMFKSWVWVKAVIKMFILHLPAKLLPALLFSIPWFLYGAAKGFDWLTAEVLKKITAVFVLLVLISLLPVAFIMSEMGPERAWAQVSLYLTVYASILATYSGKALKKKYDVNRVSGIYVLIAVLYVLATGVTTVVQSEKYSDAYDDRIGEILENKNSGKKEILLLNPLPPSGWLHTAEISADSTHFNNAFIYEFFDLKFRIVSK